MLAVASHPTTNRALLAYEALESSLVFEDYLRQQPPGAIVGYSVKRRACPLSAWLSVLTQGNVEVTGSMLWLYDESWSGATAHSVDLPPWAHEFTVQADDHVDFTSDPEDGCAIYRQDALAYLRKAEFSAMHPPTGAWDLDCRSLTCYTVDEPGNHARLPICGSRPRVGDVLWNPSIAPSALA